MSSVLVRSRANRVMAKSDVVAFSSAERRCRFWKSALP